MLDLDLKQASKFCKSGMMYVAACDVSRDSRGRACLKLWNSENCGAMSRCWYVAELTPWESLTISYERPPGGCYVAIVDLVDKHCAG